jgi:hypothetical protein
LSPSRHLSIVGNVFRVVGVVIGVPSLVALVYLGWALISFQSGVPPASRGGDDGVGGLINTAARGMGAVFELVAAASRWIAEVLTVVSLVCSSIGASLFFTGRGLLQHATWARIVGALFALVVLLSSFWPVVNLSRGPAAVFSLLICSCIYTLWVLGWRF